MRIIIAGSRSVSEQDVRKALHCCSWVGFTSAVVSGTAQGADKYGEKWAEENQIKICRVPAEWEKYGKRAGPLRNKMMAENAEGLIAVWDGQSRGTRSMIDLAMKFGLRITVLHTDTEAIEEHLPSGVLSDVWAIADERAGIKEHEAHMSRLQAEHEAGAETLNQILFSVNHGKDYS